jgi:hypothetical protein
MIIIHGQQRFWRRGPVALPPSVAGGRVWTGHGAKAPVIGLAVQGTYPNRVLVSVTGLDVGRLVSVSRVPAGSTTRTAVRGGNAITVTSDTLVLIDAEAPFGVLLTYILTIDQVDYALATVTLSLTKAALSDAISGDAAEVVVLAWPEKRTERTASVFAVGGRNIVVSGQASGFTGTIDLFVETDDSKNNVLNLLRGATSGIVQLRSDQSVTSDGVDCYIVAQSWAEQRYSQDGSDERRIISMDVVETTTWGPTLESSTFTLADIALAYPGGILQDIADDYATLLELGLGDFSS